jgi:actin-related protein
MLEYMFEQFEVPCLRAESPAVLALHASGLCDGLVIDVGNRLSITPIVQGYVLVRRLRCTSDFDGRRLKKTSVRRSKRRTVRSAGAWR